MKKSERIELIKKLLLAQDILTQDDLVAALLALGVEVTQATVSRDMRELRLIKVPAQTGGYRYALPETSRVSSDVELFQAVVKAIRHQDKQVAIVTSPGSAMLFKKRLLSQFESLIFTVLSDDNTVLVIATSTKNALKIYQTLSELA
ncbi:MAG: ArgR family transcriptional regulator [Streptococcaceae bacterium]|jgi:transcriptional regulator of arginine metabolism|nr:ArgR family transcriptional regulator [Streptococcaceae bacterium]